MSTLFGRLGLTGTEEVELTWLKLLGLEDHRTDKKNRPKSRRYSTRKKIRHNYGARCLKGVSVDMRETGWSRKRAAPEGGRGGS